MVFNSTDILWRMALPLTITIKIISPKLNQSLAYEPRYGRVRYNARIGALFFLSPFLTGRMFVRRTYFEQFDEL